MEKGREGKWCIGQGRGMYRTGRRREGMYRAGKRRGGLYKTGM